MRRNSTSFPKQNFELLKSIIKDKNDPLRYHQRLVYEYVMRNPWVRGILIYHKMGAGKSILGNSICEGFIQQDSDRKIIFMASKSLHNNFRDSIAQYRAKVAESEGNPVTDSTEHINTHYQFISLNASNMLTQVHRAIKKDAEMDAFDDGVITAEDAEEFSKLEQIGDLEHSVLVIDEAHNLFNSISNGSKNAAGLYHLIMKAKDIKVILLTGSPIVNDPFELAIAMNMIAGPLGSHTLFGEDYLDFTKYFIGADNSVASSEKPSDDTEDLTASVRKTFMQHKDKFVNRIVGLVSYYGADDASQRALYPEQLPIIIDRVPMSGRQYAAYITARDREIEETQKGARFASARAPLQKPQGMSSSYRVRSRQLSNFLFPDYASKTWKNPKGYLLYEKYLDKIQDVNLRDLGSSAFSGGKDDESKMGLEIWSPKILKMLHNIQTHCPFSFIEEKKVKKGKGENDVARPLVDSDLPEIAKTYAAKHGYETYTRLDFKAVREDNNNPYFKYTDKKKGNEFNIEQMTRKDIPDALETYKKIHKMPPEVDFTDVDVKVYMAKKGDLIEGIGIIKPGYGSINKTRMNANYIVSVGSLSPEPDCVKELIAQMHKDYPKIYLKLDKTIPQSGIMRTLYEDREFYVYRESDGYWYLRHIMGAKESQKQQERPKSKAGFGPGLIYSQFIDSGVKLVGRALQAHGFVEIKDLNDALKHKKGAAFAIISGQVDTDVRSEIVKIFNSEENKHGEHLAILLVTSTGAEGLDLKNIRHIHVMEPYWHWARIAQVLARGVRMGSHLALPESERNVQPYIYLSDYPPADVINDFLKKSHLEHIQKQMAKEDTTDVTLYKKSVNNQKLIDSFLEAAQEASIDCPIHYGDPSSKNDEHTKHCLMCMPTDEPLFIDDLDKDIKTPSRCQPLTEKTVKAKSVTITVTNEKGEATEKEFMYSIGELGKSGKKTITVFEFMPDVGAYSPMYENHPLFDELENAIRKKEKMKT